jgi:arginase
MRQIELIEAPSNLGLKPLHEGHVPGAWRAPEALRRAGLHRSLHPAVVRSLPRPHYRLDAESGTKIRNGHAIRNFSEELATLVQAAIGAGRIPLVIGGDCSIILGCLLGARRSGRCGLIHIDGHSDFFHPGNYDASARLGSAAGMDLALATGRGEPLLTDWGKGQSPLVDDADVLQIGERDELDPAYPFGEIRQTSISQMTVRRLHEIGVAAAAAEAARFVARRKLSRVWIHVDVDVLDQSIMPAVDSPGTPGFSFAELRELLGLLTRTLPVAGVDIAIFDPDLDPTGTYGQQLAQSIGDGLQPLTRPQVAMPRPEQW